LYKVNHIAFSDRGSYTNVQRNAPVIGFEARATLSGTTAYAGFRGRMAAATAVWNLKMSGTAQNWLAGNTMHGTVDSIATALVDIGGSTTSAASLRIRSGTAPTSPNDGDAWNDSAQKTIYTRLGSVNQALSGVIFTGTADATIANSVSETSITPTGIGTLTLPANFLVVGKTVQVKLNGNYTTDAVTSPTIQLKLKLGSTTVATFSANTIPTKTSTGIFTAEFTITCRTTGASGTVMCFGEMELNDTELTKDATWKTPATATVTLDTTER